MLKKIFPFILLIFFNTLLSGNSKGVKVVFRYDDFLLKPSHLNDSLLDIFRRNNIPLCIGIVPFDTSGNFIEKMDSLQISALRQRISRGEVEVALHGFNHRNHLKPGRFSKPTYSEWATATYDDQLRKLSAGKAILDSILGTDIKIFVPPFNTYDDNTLRALETLGFDVISGSRQGSPNGKSIQFIPSTYEDFSLLSEIIEKNRDKDVSIIVYFHPYTFKGGSDKFSTREEGNMTMQDLDLLLSKLNGGPATFYSFTGLSKTGEYNGESFRNNSMKYNVLKKSLLYLKLANYGTLRPAGYTGFDYIMTALNILLHILVFFVVFLLTGVFLKIFHPMVSSVPGILFIFILPVFVYMVYIRNDFSFGMIFIVIFVILSALVCGIIKYYKDSQASLNEKRSDGVAI